MNNEDRTKNENMIDDIYSERSRYLLNTDSLLENMLKK